LQLKLRTLDDVRAMKNELIAVLHFVKFVKCTCELGDNMPVITTFQVCGNIYYDCINVCSYEI